METQDSFTVYTSEPLDLGEEQTETTEVVEDAPKETEETPPADEAKTEPKDEEPKEGHTRYQKRIDKLVKQREEYAREAEILRKELESIKSLPKNEARELDPLSFASYEDYIEALNSQPKTEPKKVESKEVKETTHVDETSRKLDDAFDEAREAYDDFDKVVFDSTLPFTSTMVVAFTEMDKSGDIAYYLAKNKDELKEIATLTPTKQVIALEKIADKLSNPKKVEKKVSQAPEPINPVTAQGDVVEKDPSKMSFKEYETYMNSQKRKQGFW